jgi:hypothetical protein
MRSDLRKQGIAASRVRKESKMFKSEGKVTAEDIALFARQLATMLNAGIPMVQSFEIIGVGNDKPAVQKLVLAIKSEEAVREVLAVASIADRLKAAMSANGAVELFGRQAEAVARAALAEPGGPGRPGAPNKELVGRSAQVIARAAGVDVPAGTRILLVEVGRDHPLVWTEQLMPVLPLVRMPDAGAAIEFAVLVEHGYRHTAMIHSHDIERLSRMAKLMDCSIFVKNGPCFAGLGQGGAGYASFTVASPTGEGVTRARTFTRERRCTLVDAFRII